MTPWRGAGAAFVLFLLVSGPLVAQERPEVELYSAEEVSAGAELYQTYCALCHGARGDALPPLDLLRGKFLRQNMSDERLTEVMIKGSEGGAMPPSNVSDADAEKIVAFLRSEALGGTLTLPAGDAQGGKALFAGNDCFTCHRVQDQGSYAGPDLTDLGTRGRTMDELKRSMLEPDAEIAPENRVIQLVTREAETVRGTLLNQDAFSLQLRDTNGQLRSYQRADVGELSFVEKGLMPSYRGKLSEQEVIDIIHYLVAEQEGQP
ncbi:MAG: c-type cytochrome [Luteitalea sp.]|nr:c-type cytochrome [Luteitalea sp.]